MFTHLDPDSGIHPKEPTIKALALPMKKKPRETEALCAANYEKKNPMLICVQIFVGPT